MKKIILLLAVLFLCFGFSDKGKLEIEKPNVDCCDFRPFPCVYLKLLPPGYHLNKRGKFQLTQEKIFLLERIEAKKDSSYIFAHRIVNAYGFMETSVSAFILNEQSDTLANTLLNEKKYSGLTYISKKDETLRLYLNPHENPLLLQKHKKKDICATVRCIEYAIGTRSIIKED